MANNFSSPNVSANEIDQSFRAIETVGAGAAVIGTTPKGPAFRPTIVRSFDEFRQVFGELDVNHPVTFAAYNYLRNAGSLRVVRVLGNDDATSTSNGYSLDGGVAGVSDVSGAASSTGSVLAEIHYTGSKPTVVGVATDANRFVVSFSWTGATFAATASFQTSSADYIEKVLNTDPTKFSTYGHYLAATYRYQPQATSASWWSVSMLSSSWKTFDRDHEAGQTPWVKSQPLGGVEFDLFKVHTTADGRATNDSVKVTISNVRPSANPTIYPYGTFDLLVRDFYDLDTRPVVLESHTGLTLDPEDQNYLLRRVGDVLEEFSDTERKFQVTRGQYPGRPGSRYVRIQLSDANFPPEALPFGHRGFPKTRFSGSSAVGANKVPDLKYVTFQRDTQGNHNDAVCFGVMFVSGGVADRMRAFPDIPVGDIHLTSSDAEFSLKGLTTFSDNGTTRRHWLAATTSYQPLYASGTVQRFTMPLYGGFDGWDLRVHSPIGQWTLTNEAVEATSIGVVSLKRAVDTVRNPDILDMNVLAVPGVHNKRVTDFARTMANERKDVLYLMDITGSTVSEAEGALTTREIDDNYAASYYPDVKQEHPTVPGRLVRVPASVAALSAIGYTDRVSQPFFAPAGLNRGGLTENFGVRDVVDRLDFKDRDRLYDARINPIGFFTQEGVVIYGQKTLQARPSALDRVNVRRLLILAKKSVLQEAKGLLFEPNNADTWTRFVNKVNPILDRIRREQGLMRFRVVMDSTTNTPDLVDRNAMNGKIILQPTKAAEYISIDFVITNSGVSFGS